MKDQKQEFQQLIILNKNNEEREYNNLILYKVNYMEVLKITDENFEEEVLKSDKTVIVDFYADWCGPCKMQSPIIDAIANEKSNVKVGKLNVDENPNTAVKYDVMSIPTILIIKGGQVAKEFVGLTDKEEIAKYL